jgi:hypothetical protein
LKLGAIVDVVEISRKISVQIAEGKQWDEEVIIPNVEEVRVRVVAILDQGDAGEKNILSWRRKGTKRGWLINSDAMNLRCAGTMFVGIEVVVLFVREFSEEEKAWHINVKETVAAVETWWAWRERVGWSREMGPCCVCMGVDNRTAVRAINMGFYPANEIISAKVWSMVMEAEQMEAELFAVYVPGYLQVSDEPTRKMQGAGMEKRLQCRAVMEVLIDIERKKRDREM